MPETNRPVVWPSSSWRVLKRIVRAWYTAEEGTKDVTQRGIAQIAGIQPSRLSANKPFLQSVGIIEAEGMVLTDVGKQFGLGISSENERVMQQALQNLIRTNPLLSQLWNVIRGRGATDATDFEAQVVLITKQGKNSDYFATGINVLKEMLLESGLVGMAENNLLRPTKNDLKEESQPIPSRSISSESDIKAPTGLRRIPIPVSASTVWYIEVSETAEESEIEKFIEMQKLMFSRK